ncbi:penicillin-binding protein 1C [Pedobacter yulinensis]|uniref:peptidoglycan glycosyltransferase n=1 Tax=Pedobacter yulinensis TaxID=2126353 RepID=A0A2T3HKI8_9SPHI|nr:penicillin-binding protein 1C [Pedobacter yulinensis]PST82944.1 penicillin-binding protein 1C [Pedobacter yulinensis]
MGRSYQIKKWPVRLQGAYRPYILSDLLLLALLAWFLLSLPGRLFMQPTSYVIESADGRLLSAAIASDGQWRFPLADTVPEKFLKCITAFEDKRFSDHPGVDILAAARAFRQNLRARSVVSGGSTLSMQVIRLSRRQNRSIGQKLIEAVLALRLELRYNKSGIMRLYAANAPFGTNVVGLEAAAWRYFGRPAASLSWGETATLAVLPNSPSLVHPGRNIVTLVRKRNALLDRMAALGFIDRETAALSKLEPVPGKPLPLPQDAPHLLNRFRLENSDTAKTKLLSSIDYNLQQRVSSLLKRYNNRYRANDINNIAALVLNVQTGKVLSYVGNVYQPQEPELESHVDMISALRSPGSTLKPLLYASMLSEGFILPQSLVPDVPTQISGYTPQNYDLGYDGAIAADQALSRSLNIPAVKMLQQYKYERFYNQLKKLGITSLNQPPDHYGLSLILGGAEVSMWELSRTYLGMARSLNHFNTYNGRYDPHDYDDPSIAADARDRRFDKYGLQPAAALDHGSIWATFNAMEELMRPGEEGLWEQFSSSRRLAWKTGTSFGFRDAWAIGMSPDHVVCVWVGNADGEGRPGLTGIESAAPVLFDIFKMLPAGKWFLTPRTKLHTMRICPESGYKAGEYCTNASTRLVPPAGEKTGICPYHRLVHLDATGNFRVTDRCESISRMRHQSWFVLPPSMAYYYSMKNTGYRPLPPFLPGCTENTAGAMEMIYPKNKAMIYIPLELDGNRGRVVMNLAHRIPGKKVYWHLDGQFAGTTQSYHQLEILASPGKHNLALVDEDGERLEQNFTVAAADRRAN